MRVGLGPRFLIEAGFIIAVAVVAGIERLRTLLIVVLMAAAWGIVFVVEFLSARVGAAGRAAQGAQAVSTGDLVETSGTATRVQPQARVHAEQEPEPAREPDTSPSPRPEPAQPVPEWPKPAPEHPEPPPEPPQIAAVAPPPEPETTVEPEPEAEPEPQVVSLSARSTAPREWNLWELERVAREESGDTARDEERSFLLMYLREFAAADGMLPADFDAVVREAFGDVLHAV